MAEEAKGEIKTLENTVRIVEALNERGSANITGLESALDVPNSTIYDHVKTLERYGYIVQEGEEYRLSLKFLELGCKVKSQFDFLKVSRPELGKLSEKTGERVNLVVKEREMGVFVEIMMGDDAVYQDISIGSHVELYCTSAGKAILAYQPEEEVEAVLARGFEPKTPNTLTTVEEFEAELETIRKQGFALDLEERHLGLQCVAAPIKDEDGIAVGAVSVSGPVSRLPEDRLRNSLADQVVETASVIELNSIYM